MAASEGVVFLNFKWAGPTHWQKEWPNGGSAAQAIDLLFENSPSEISVPIPDSLSYFKIHKLPFLVRSHFLEEPLDGSYRNLLDKITSVDELMVPIEKIYRLAIRARILDFPEAGSMIDHFGKMTEPQTPLESNREVLLRGPEKLEIDQTYDLVVVASEDCFLSAYIVKEGEISTVLPSIQEDASQLIRDRMDLSKFLKMTLLPSMGALRGFFSIKLSTLPRNGIVLVSDSEMEHLDIKAIQGEVEKIEEDSLRKSIVNIRFLHNRYRQSKARFEFSQMRAFEKEIFRACVHTMGSDGLANIMRSYLRLRFQQDPSPYGTSLIERVVNEFVKNCMQNAS